MSEGVSMHIRKAFMALNPQGHIVRADNADPDTHYRCHHCDCPLLFQNRDPRCKPWFEHDVQVLTEAQLKQCAYFDDLTLAERKLLELQRQLRNMQPVAVVRRWHCIDCGLCYSGGKRCPKCGLGIYSVEAKAG